MNCNTCDYRCESPISGMCEGCVNCEKHSNKTKGRQAMTTKEMLALKYVEDVAKSHKDAAFSAFCAGYSVSERKNLELQKTIESMKLCSNCEHNDVDTFFGDSCLHTNAKPDRDKFKRDCLAQNKKHWQLIKE